MIDGVKRNTIEEHEEENSRLRIQNQDLRQKLFFKLMTTYVTGLVLGGFLGYVLGSM